MSEAEKDIDQLLSKIDKRESTFRKRTVFYIAFLVIAGAAWLVFTGKEVKSLKKEAKVIKVKADELETRIAVLDDSLSIKRKKIKTLEKALHIGDNFSSSKVEIDEIDIKKLSFGLKDVSKVYRDIKSLQDRGVKFSLNGTNPQRGFNSVTMMSFILKNNNIIRTSPRTTSQLIEALPAASGGMQTGDIIVYEAGYCMLYVKAHKEFVLGMTPFGILEVKPEFAGRIKILRPTY